MLATSIFIETPEHVFTRRKTTCSGHDGYAFSPLLVSKAEDIVSSTINAVSSCKKLYLTGSLAQQI